MGGSTLKVQHRMASDMAKVKMVINIEFETWNDETANAAVVRLPFELRLQILEGTDEHTLPGVLPGTVAIEVIEKRIY